MTDLFDGGRLAEELRALVSDAEALLHTSTGTANAPERERAQADAARSCARG